jgi:hypothetical protein
MSLQTNVTNLATRAATECKSIRTLVNNNSANLNALTTSNKANLVAAINELDAALDALINDSATGSTTTWSSTKIADAIAVAIAALVDSAPGLLDTLNELAAALGDDPNFATTMSTALGLRVRVDASQSFNGTQQTQARTNIGAVAASDIGNTDENFVTTFEAGLV